MKQQKNLYLKRYTATILMYQGLDYDFKTLHKQLRSVLKLASNPCVSSLVAV